MDAEVEVIELPDPDEINDIVTMRELLRHLIATVGSIQAKLDKKEAENAELKRLVFGKKSERIPVMDREVRKRRKKSAKATRADKKRSKEKRRKNREIKRELPTEDVFHGVPEEECRCPKCGGESYKDLGEGEISFEYEFIPAQLVRRRHIRQKKVCECAQHIVIAPAPVRVSEGVEYGPGFHAHVVVSKCADSIPLYRQAKQFNRAGVPICRSTLCDLFHRSAGLLKPLQQRMLELIAKSRYVNADETPIQVQEEEKTRRAYIWTFIAEEIVAYVYSPSRSGETPLQVLGESKGYLQVDQYSGYNQVTTPDRRERVGCVAHMRRYFWKAQQTSPDEARYVLEQIVSLYEVEYAAAQENVLGTERHLEMRKAISAPVIGELEAWLQEQKPLHPPKGPMAEAINYALGNWKSLIRFLEDPKISLDNNVSERQLRLIALGRKNFLFVGHDEAGENLAVLQSMVSSCELNGVNPHEYLTDVLIRIQNHPRSRIDDLLPHKWKPPPNPAPS